jgi:hypothetical protein
VPDHVIPNGGAFGAALRSHFDINVRHVLSAPELAREPRYSPPFSLSGFSGGSPAACRAVLIHSSRSSELRMAAFNVWIAASNNIARSAGLSGRCSNSKNSDSALSLIAFTDTPNPASLFITFGFFFSLPAAGPDALTVQCAGVQQPSPHRPCRTFAARPCARQILRS